MSQRKIIHVDMDAFFASVEQRDNPEFQGKPLIVGGDPEGRGVVAACSYEAREFGVHSAMPCARAARLCPRAIFVSPRFDAYRRASDQIRGVFSEYTDLVEPLSLDEAYLDVSDCRQHDGSATLIASDIKQRILAVTGLTASAGVSYNKFLAKIASDMDKPNGLYVIPPHAGESFVSTLPIGRFYGVGKVTEARMKSLGIHCGADLRSWTREALVAEFGNSADYYYRLARGIDDRPVEPNRERKSVGAESTYARDISSADRVDAELRRLAERVCNSLRQRELLARRITLKVRYADFSLVTRATTLDKGSADPDAWRHVLTDLLARTEAGQRPVRLLGVSASMLEAQTGPDRVQLELPIYPGDVPRQAPPDDPAEKD